MGRRYQLGRHWRGTRISAALIDTFLDPTARSAIDVGCNEGAFTALLARRGLAVKGFEGSPETIALAETLAREMGLSPDFEVGKVALEDVSGMAETDVTLFLSVHHQIVAAQGVDYAEGFLRALAAKTRKQLFFQPAAIRRKYKQNMPFKDNDLTAISRHYLELLSDLFPHARLIGFSNNEVPQREPLRPMLLFSHAPIEINKDSDPLGFVEELQKARRATHPLMMRLRRKR